jgi:predicted ATPase/DNA-binding winged helix-turn-helix (wHTH) protein
VRTLPDTPLRFGPFEWLHDRQLLLKDAQPVQMSPRVAAILAILLEHPGELVLKKEIQRRIWPVAGVVDATLRGHVLALRKVLQAGLPGTDCVQNVIGHGYRLVIPVTIGAERSGERLRTADNLPTTPTRLFGRESLIDSLALGLKDHRLITLAGPAGIGKTRVAIATAVTLRADFKDGVRFVDLSSVTTPARAYGAVASALGLQSISVQPLQQIRQFVKDLHMLLILDNCEQVIDAAAHLAEALIADAPGMRVLTTSREPLRARGEWVSRLACLELPPETATLTVWGSQGFSAVQMFVEHARRTAPEFELQDGNVATLVAICRSLDGLPLAIELAAARVDTLGVEGLAVALHDCLDILATDPPATNGRQSALRATLDWSYNLLPQSEQRALAELGVFASCFDAAAAQAVLGEAAGTRAAVMNTLADLAARSLLSVRESGGQVMYQLLVTTRAYVLERLQLRADHNQVRRRHATLCCHWQFGWTDTGDALRPSWREVANNRVEDVRAALDWCFCAEGDAALGAELAGNSAPLWFTLSFLEEYRHYLERALASSIGAELSEKIRLKLHSALGNALFYTRGAVPAATVAFREALSCAQRAGNAEDVHKALWGLWSDRIIGSDYPTALELSERYRDLPTTALQPHFRLTAERMLALSRHLCGDQRAAHQHARAVVRKVATMATAPGDRAFHDYRVSSRSLLARILSLKGETDRSLEMARESVEIARSVGHTLSLCYALTFGCTVALWAGKLSEAEFAATCLLEQSGRHNLSLWQTWGRCLQLAIRQRNGDPRVPGLLGELCQDTSFTQVLHLETLGTFAPALATATVLDRAENGTAGWSAPELLRVKAERLLHGSVGEVTAAEALLGRSLSAAREQGALLWELRSTTTLAGILQKQGRPAQAIDQLQPVLDRFRMGGSNPDSLRAAALLRKLRGLAPGGREYGRRRA